MILTSATKVAKTTNLSIMHNRQLYHAYLLGILIQLRITELGNNAFYSPGGMFSLTMYVH